MADATDLKSVSINLECGFESRHRHPLKRHFARGKGIAERSGLICNDAQRNARKRNLFANYSSTGYPWRPFLITARSWPHVFLATVHEARRITLPSCPNLSELHSLSVHEEFQTNSSSQTRRAFTFAARQELADCLHTFRRYDSRPRLFS